MHFPKYAEIVGYTPGQPFDVSKTQSDSVKMLSAAAKETSTWILGGMFAILLCMCEVHIATFVKDLSLRRTVETVRCTIRPRFILLRVRDEMQLARPIVLICFLGDLVAIHRKVHLFDIDIPGKIKFKVCWVAND